MRNFGRVLSVLSFAAALALAAAAEARAGTGSLTGTVTDAVTSAPVAGVPVFVSGSGVFVRATTDASGVYAVGGLDAGTYYASTRNAQGYIDQIFQGLVCVGCSASNGTPITVSDGTVTSGIDFALQPGARIAGHISDTAT